MQLLGFYIKDFEDRGIKNQFFNQLYELIKK